MICLILNQKFGIEFQFKSADDPKSYLHLCKVTEVIAGKNSRIAGVTMATKEILLLLLNCLRKTIKPEVKLTHAGLETFPASNTDLAKENFVAGWTHIIGISLKDFLENNIFWQLKESFMIKPTTVDEYIAGFPKETQKLLQQFRTTIKNEVPNAEETISYAMPAFKLKGKHLVYFAAFKNHIGFYASPTGHKEFAAEYQL